MNKSIVKELMYEADEKKTMTFVKSCKDPETLHLYAYNYNWGDGFEEPTTIMNNPVCSLSTALQLFYDADGLEFLSDMEQEVDDWQQPWLDLVKALYQRIIDRDFSTASIKFVPPLTKVELYQIKKDLSDKELVLITPIEGTDCNIQL